MDDTFQRGLWIRKQSLGKGGFGTVWLWHNEESDTKIAVKECKENLMSEKMRSCWQAEIEIMGKLQHSNLVQAVPVPEELAPPPSQPPVLAMEFCEGGDLRKVLNLPQNCFGLTECEIRQLGVGIGSALDYLHTHRITHRDLKPENIVLQPDGNQILYKIIDLGYAKVLDMNSLCNSFVGTEKYLAPELLIDRPYTKTVDYWSFGVVMFECITGFRPFLPQASPAVWYPAVSKKSPEDICAFHDEQSQVVFSKNLPEVTHLRKPLSNWLEQWLRLMLRWNPQERGGGKNCFKLLQHIMEFNIFTVLNVESSTLHSYVVRPEYTVMDLCEALQTETGIPADNQCLVLASGIRLGPNDSVVQETTIQQLSGEPKVFLFRVGPMQVQEKKRSILPSNVEVIVNEPTVLLAPKVHRKAWAEAVYWFTKESNSYHHLTLAHRAALLNLMLGNATLLRQKSELESEIGQLSAVKEFFKSSLEFDINKCKVAIEASKQLYQAGGAGLIENWRRTATNLETLDNLIDRVKSMRERINQVNTAVQELQRRPVIQSNELKEFESKSKELYNDFLRANQCHSQEIIEHHEMAHLVAQCFFRRDELLQDLYKSLREVRDLNGQLEPLFKQPAQTMADIKKAQEQLTTMQRQRQQTLWSFISNPQQASPGELHPFDAPTISNNLESTQLVQDCRDNTQRFKNIVADMLTEQERSMGYFSSLDSN